jgi:hypothetical protein
VVVFRQKAEYYGIRIEEAKGTSVCQDTLLMTQLSIWGALVQTGTYLIAL